MTRLLALAFATIGSACAPLPTAVTVDASGQPLLQPLEAKAVNLPAEVQTKTTVPMTTEKQKDAPLDTLSRTLHVYWFFGSR
jgi:hypothetical protein